MFIKGYDVEKVEEETNPTPAYCSFRIISPFPSFVHSSASFKNYETKRTIEQTETKPTFSRGEGGTDASTRANWRCKEGLEVGILTTPCSPIYSSVITLLIAIFITHSIHLTGLTLVPFLLRHTQSQLLPQKNDNSSTPIRDM